MTAIEYLLEVRAMDYRIQNLSDEIKEVISLSQRAGALDYSREHVDGGSETKEPAFLKALDRAESKHEHYLELLKEYEKFRKEAFDNIHKLSDALDTRILYGKFFQYKTLETISRELYYSFDTVRYHYRKGLREFNSRKLWEN